jgi:hypothetical protein
VQPKPALLLAACGALLGALAMAPVPAMGLATPARSTCQAPGNLEVNSWIGQRSPGQFGLWNNDKNWSLGHYPGSRSTTEIACIQTAATVVMWQGAGLNVHVAAVDLGGDGALVVQPSNALFVEANPDQTVSTVGPGSRVEIQGAALGGQGRIEVEGVLTLTSAPKDHSVLVATRSCARGCKTRLRGGRHGTISVLAGGLFAVDDVRARVSDSYYVVLIGGEMRMQGDRGQVRADGGTRLALRTNPAGDREAALTFLNNGGWYAGPVSRFAKRATRVQIHGGVVAKEQSSGTSSIQGIVTTTEALNASVDSGTLAIASDDVVQTDLSGGATYSTGSCLDDEEYGCKPVASTDYPQIASVELPPDGKADQVTVTEGESTGPLTHATVFSGTLGLVSKDNPAVLELRYDMMAKGLLTPSSRVAVSEEKGDPFHDLKPCTGGQIPVDARACVDRRPDQSRVESDGDLVMVVRTLHFSRYICR